MHCLKRKNSDKENGWQQSDDRVAKLLAMDSLCCSHAPWINCVEVLVGPNNSVPVSKPSGVIKQNVSDEPVTVRGIKFIHLRLTILCACYWVFQWAGVAILYWGTRQSSDYSLTLCSIKLLTTHTPSILAGSPYLSFHILPDRVCMIVMVGGFISTGPVPFLALLRLHLVWFKHPVISKLLSLWPNHDVVRVERSCGL